MCPISKIISNKKYQIKLAVERKPSEALTTHSLRIIKTLLGMSLLLGWVSRLVGGFSRAIVGVLDDLFETVSHFKIK